MFHKFLVVVGGVVRHFHVAQVANQVNIAVIIVLIDVRGASIFFPTETATWKRSLPGRCTSGTIYELNYLVGHGGIFIIHPLIRANIAKKWSTFALTVP